MEHTYTKAGEKYINIDNIACAPELDRPYKIETVGDNLYMDKAVKVDSYGNIIFFNENNSYGCVIDKNDIDWNSSLKKLKLNAENIKINPNYNSYNENECIIRIPAGLSVAEYIKQFSADATNVLFPIQTSAMAIQPSAFTGFSALTSMYIPPYVSSVGEGAFDGCSSLYGVTLPDGLTTQFENACGKNLSVNIKTYGENLDEIISENSTGQNLLQAEALINDEEFHQVGPEVPILGPSCYYVFRKLKIEDSVVITKIDEISEPVISAIIQYYWKNNASHEKIIEPVEDLLAKLECSGKNLDELKEKIKQIKNEYTNQVLTQKPTVGSVLYKKDSILAAYSDGCQTFSNGVRLCKTTHDYINGTYTYRFDPIEEQYNLELSNSLYKYNDSDGNIQPMFKFIVQGEYKLKAECRNNINFSTINSYTHFDEVFNWVQAYHHNLSSISYPADDTNKWMRRTTDYQIVPFKPWHKHISNIIHDNDIKECKISELSIIHYNPPYCTYCSTIHNVHETFTGINDNLFKYKDDFLTRIINDDDNYYDNPQGFDLKFLSTLNTVYLGNIFEPSNETLSAWDKLVKSELSTYPSVEDLEKAIEEHKIYNI